MLPTFTFRDILPYGAFADGVLRVTDGFSLTLDDTGEAECLLITALAMFEGEKLPTIQFSLTAPGQDSPMYASPIYTFGKPGEYTRKQWRVPPMFLPGMAATVDVVVPDGTTLLLRNMSARFDAHVADWHGGVRHNAHLGFWGIAPDNTMPALELAAQCGYPACIVVPKVTADGVLVCIHDDTINRTAQDESGAPPAKDMTVWDYTYEELLRWDYGAYKNPVYKGTRLPKLEEFFALCARTGMRPMFSTHPGLTLPQWEEVKWMLKKFGLLESFHIKSFETEVLAAAHTVFGESNDGYTRDCSNWDPGLIGEVLDAGIDPYKSRVGIELLFSRYTPEAGAGIAKAILDAGMFAAAWGVPRMTSEEYLRVMGYGVTEFTEDHHCSMGLNW